MEQLLKDFGRVVVLDGGLATELERKGADLEDPLWSAKLLIEQPNLIKEVHKDFLRGGADILITSSYQASFEGGLNEQRSAQLIQLSVQLAKDAINEWWESPERDPLRTHKPLGPYGAFLCDGSEYNGKYIDSVPVEVIEEFHRKRVTHLLNADLIIGETIPSLAEANIIAKILGEVEEASGIRSCISFSCRDGEHISHGEHLNQVIDAVKSWPRGIGVGVNCTPPEFISSLLLRLQETQRPVIVYPNSGEGWESGKWVGSATSLTKLVPQWVSLGAVGIGGCCRVTSEQIRQLSSILSDKS